MRVGILCHSSFGGSTRIATELAIELHQQHHTVHVFSLTVPFGKWDRPYGVMLHCLQSDNPDPRPQAELDIDWSEQDFNGLVDLVLDVIKTEGLDVLHFHYAVPFAYIASEIKHRLGDTSPLIIGTLHGTDVSIHSDHTYKGIPLKQALRHADCLTTVSQSHAKLATTNFELSESPEVISNFVELARFDPTPNNSVKRHKSAKPIIVHASNFRPVKQTPLMAQVFSEIVSRFEAELWLIGDGPDMPQVKEIFARQGITQHVYFWGLQQNISSILLHADVLLMTSKTESFCLVALEAMACGVPVLSTKVGGLPEVVLHGETGLLFDSHDPQYMAEKAVELLADPARLARMRQAALKRASCLDRAEIVASYAALYDRLLTASMVAIP